MSDIRFNRWLHQSGTGGVSQDSSGNIGIGTTVPTKALDVRGDVNIGNTININNASGIISATTFTGTTGTFSGNVSAVDATFTGNVTIGGTLTYEDVANIDAVGIITAQSDIIVGGGLTVTGISTFNNDIKLLDNDKLNFGIGEDLQIYHDGSASYIHEQGTGDLNLCVGHAGSKFVIQSGTSGGHLAEFNYNGAAELFYSGNQKLETTNTGAVVTGILTATTFSGNLTGNITGDLTGNLAGISSIAAISSSISDTAVDVFVYDTRKDSDGGAWRKRTKHTSWYNETLNTSTRGSRKEFPAVAVIVAESNQVTIYDGDDPDLPMWMVFNTTSGNLIGAGALRGVTALNGIIVTPAAGYTMETRFISDYSLDWFANQLYEYKGNIEQRNDTLGFLLIESYGLVDSASNDAAMTVLPNAPIDDTTGLPVPTIAVATNSGVSVIRDDGNVFDVIDGNGSRKCYDVSFTKDHKLMHTGDLGAGSTHAGNVFVTNILTADRGEYDNNSDLYRWYSTSQYYPRINGGNTFNTRVLDPVDVGGHHYAMADVGMSLIEDGTSSSVSNTNGMVAYITSDYNSGYQHGDIKGAFLSDTDIEDNVELVTNGTFDTNTTGWTVNGGGSVTVSSGQAQMTNNGTTNCSLDQSVTTVVGKTYEVSATITPQGGGPLPRLYVGSEFVQVGSNSNSAQTVTLIYVATSTSTLISVNANTNVNNAVTIFDNVTMKLTNDVKGSEKIANYNFAADFSTQWEAKGNANTSYDATNDRVTVTSTQNYSGIRLKNASLPTLAQGKRYIMTVDIHSINNPIRFGVVSGGVKDSINSTGAHAFTFTAQASVTEVFVEKPSGSNSTFVLNSVSIREAEDDRSTNNNGLQVYGTVPKSAVATGADLVAYGPFSTSNYLQHPYYSDFLFGTDDFCITGWVNNTAPTNSVYDDIITFGNIGVVGYNGREPGNWLIQLNKEFGYNMYYRTNSGPADTGWSNYSAGGNFQKYSLNGLGIWYKITIVRKGDKMYSYTNDDLLGSKDIVGSFTTSSNLSDMKLTIGYEGGGAYGPYVADYTKMALWRISRSVPSEEQVKKMYYDEKHLFEENAKATLYGSSDAVTALAYDDSTNLLYAGTSAGRSEFQGLRRINNTTTAVTTAISASNGLVAEQ